MPDGACLRGDRAERPDLVEAGEHFVTDATPCHAWHPLNRAAGERYEQWLASLPGVGQIPQELLTEAAYRLRPREGDPEFPMDQWWPHVLRLAGKLAEERRGHVAPPKPGYRPITPNTLPMPFAAMGPAMPSEPGRAPAQHMPQNQAQLNAKARAARVKPPMPATNPAAGPQQTSG